MNNKSKTGPRILTAVAVAAILIAGSIGNGLAAEQDKDFSDGWKQRHQEWKKHKQEWLNAAIDHEANRLEIKASQQDAWANYANARKALGEHSFADRAKDADAATIARQHAEHVASKAKKLVALADATEKLQLVLSPEQRNTLDQIVRTKYPYSRRMFGYHLGDYRTRSKTVYDESGDPDWDQGIKPANTRNAANSKSAKPNMN